MICEKMSETDSGCGGYLRFPVDTSLAHFDPEVVLLLQCKFWLKRTKVWEVMSKIYFQDGGCDSHLGFSIGSIFSYYVSTRGPNAPRRFNSVGSKFLEEISKI